MDYPEASRMGDGTSAAGGVELVDEGADMEHGGVNRYPEKRLVRLRT
jgi:hypothetical protein